MMREDRQLGREVDRADGDALRLNFSDGEKLIILMICEVYKHLKIKSDIDPKFVEAAIHGGHYWGLRWAYSGIFYNYENNTKTVSEVVDVLEMWSFIESAYGKLSKTDKERVEAEPAPFGKHVVFRGFDGNNESVHLSIAHFLIDDLKRFSNFKGRDLNSHMPVIEAYRRMFKVFEPIRRTLIGQGLSASQIIEILNERVHPENRKP